MFLGVGDRIFYHHTMLHIGDYSAIEDDFLVDSAAPF